MGAPSAILQAGSSRLLVAVAAIAIALGAPGAAAGATITVDTLDDQFPTVGDPADCELREALTAANADAADDGCSTGAGTDTIEFDVAGTIIADEDLPALRAGDPGCKRRSRL